MSYLVYELSDALRSWTEIHGEPLCEDDLADRRAAVRLFAAFEDEALAFEFLERLQAGDSAAPQPSAGTPMLVGCQECL